MPGAHLTPSIKKFRYSLMRMIGVTKQLKQVDDFLKDARLNSHHELYAIGLANNGITLFKQQMRALNLVYCLEERNKLQHRIAIIGGGAAGATAAISAKSLGYHVALFEQRPSLFHLQLGCDIRWLHPHIYDWPAPGSDSPYAGLPFLDWQFGTAAEVATSLQREWDRAVREPSDAEIEVHLRASAHISERKNGKIAVRWDNSDQEKRCGEEQFDTVILAVGFGLEKGVHGNEAQSYWRNDSINQPLPGVPSQRPVTYFVSGTGDGGLIDLLRVCISDFNQGRILEDLFKSDAALVDDLRDIKNTWDEIVSKGKANTIQSDWLFLRYESLRQSGALRNLLEKLTHNRQRQDTTVFLNANAASFSEALSLSKASVFNSLLAYSLYQIPAFSYVPGKCEKTAKSTARVEHRGVAFDYPVDRLILRHGPIRAQTLRGAGLEQDEIDQFSPSSSISQFDSPCRLWPPGWWKQNQKPPVDPGRSRIEFVSPVTQTIATTFVRSLGDILVERTREKGNQFRVALHRIASIRGIEMFQQISHYAGTQTGGEVGRAIEIKAGIVGAACRYGAPLVVSRENDFDQLWKDLVLEQAGARPIRSSVQSMLACPFFAPNRQLDEGHSVLAVLFMDSEDKSFFDDENLRIIYSACKGFIKDLDEKHDRGEVRFSTSSANGHFVRRTPIELQTLRDKYESICKSEDVFADFSHALTFRVVNSLEMHLSK